MLVYIYLQQSKPQNQTNSINEPAMKVTDYSQGAPANQKTAIIIKHDDSRFEKIIVPSDSKNTFIKSLPPSDTVAGVTTAVQ